jgi:hypothetical protein
MDFLSESFIFGAESLSKLRGKVHLRLALSAQEKSRRRFSFSPGFNRVTGVIPFDFPPTVSTVFLAGRMETVETVLPAGNGGLLGHPVETGCE